jgi:hypothetical protein
MAGKRKDTHSDSHLQNDRRDEPVNEGEFHQARIDRARAPQRTGGADESEGAPQRRSPSGRGGGDEGREAQLRASGHGGSEPFPTQLEEDFGERGRRMAGGKHDAAHTPSILDPEAD